MPVRRLHATEKRYGPAVRAAVGVGHEQIKHAVLVPINGKRVGLAVARPRQAASCLHVLHLNFRVPTGLQRSPIHVQQQLTNTEAGILGSPDVFAYPQATAATNDQVVITIVVQVAERGRSVYPVVKGPDIARFAIVISPTGLTVRGRVAFLRQRLARQEAIRAASEPGHLAGVILAGNHVLVAVVVQVVEHGRKTDAAPLRNLHDGVFGIPGPLKFVGESRFGISSYVQVYANRGTVRAHRELRPRIRLELAHQQVALAVTVPIPQRRRRQAMLLR